MSDRLTQVKVRLEEAAAWYRHGSIPLEPRRADDLDLGAQCVALVKRLSECCQGDVYTLLKFIDEAGQLTEGERSR